MSTSPENAGGVDTQEPRLTRLYDQLARYQWWRRRLSGARPGEGLAMRKRLRPGAGELAGVECLNGWLWQFAGQAGRAPRVLDLGAGFGDTLLQWSAQHAGDYLGLGLSPYQVGRAAAQAEALGVAERCRFVRQSFDSPLPGRFDLVVAIETLFHAVDLRRTLHRVAAALEPGGVLVLVEDMARDASVAGSGAGGELLRRWSTSHLHSRADYIEGLQAAGFDLEADLDLGGQLVLATAGERARRRRRLAGLRACLPIGRQVIDAFLGGVAMEELQARGDLRYRVMRARRRGD